MGDHRSSEINRIVEITAALSPDERGDRINELCGGDDTLVAEVTLRLDSDDLTQTDPARLAVDHELADIGPKDMVGPYRIVKAIGEGGMGAVFLADQTEPVKRSVAVKIIKLGMDTREVVRRFEFERRSLARLSHPNIAAVFDAGATAKGRPFFAMEYVGGPPVTEYADEQRLPLKTRLTLFAQICDGVNHAHQRGIIHRDIKPTNVLVGEFDGKPLAKLIDFGIAKTIATDDTDESHLTRFGAIIGTPNYMSPEQAGLNSDDIDVRSDVYSLGVLLYELSVGCMPFDSVEFRSGSLDEIRRIIREVEPPTPGKRFRSLLTDQKRNFSRARDTSPGRLLRRLTGDLGVIILKALEKDRNLRYPSVAALRDDVLRYLNEEPITARPASRIYRLSRFVRRHRIALVASVAVAIPMLVVVAAVLWALSTSQYRTDGALYSRQIVERVLQSAGRFDPGDNEQLVILVENWLEIHRPESDGSSVFELDWLVKPDLEHVLGGLLLNRGDVVAANQKFVQAVESYLEVGAGTDRMYSSIDQATLTYQMLGDTDAIIALLGRPEFSNGLSDARYFMNRKAKDVIDFLAVFLTWDWLDKLRHSINLETRSNSNWIAVSRFVSDDLTLSQNIIDPWMDWRLSQTGHSPGQSVLRLAGWSNRDRFNIRPCQRCPIWIDSLNGHVPDGLIERLRLMNQTMNENEGEDRRNTQARVGRDWPITAAHAVAEMIGENHPATAGYYLLAAHNNHRLGDHAKAAVLYAAAEDGFTFSLGVNSPWRLQAALGRLSTSMKADPGQAIDIGSEPPPGYGWSRLFFWKLKRLEFLNRILLEQDNVDTAIFSRQLSLLNDEMVSAQTQISDLNLRAEKFNRWGNATLVGNWVEERRALETDWIWALVIKGQIKEAREVSLANPPMGGPEPAGKARAHADAVIALYLGDELTALDELDKFSENRVPDWFGSALSNSGMGWNADIQTICYRAEALISMRETKAAKDLLEDLATKLADDPWRHAVPGIIPYCAALAGVVEAEGAWNALVAENPEAVIPLVHRRRIDLWLQD